MIRLAVTADDFGVAPEVNEAIEIAHRRGILTCASLMVGASHAADAIERARRLPTLGVGLHLVLVDGRPIRSKEQTSELVRADGVFRSNMVAAGVRFALSARARQQLRAEIDAQFDAFAATGLPFDHVNAHKHFHVHPVIAGMVIDAAKRHGVKTIRAPIQRGGSVTRRLADGYARALARRARRRDLVCPDAVFGLAGSGSFDEGRLLQALSALTNGLNEIYLHPASRDDFAGAAPGYRYRAEFDGLISDRVRALVTARNVRLGRFAEFDGRPA